MPSPQCQCQVRKTLSLARHAKLQPAISSKPAPVEKATWRLTRSATVPNKPAPTRQPRSLALLSSARAWLRVWEVLISETYAAGAVPKTVLPQAHRNTIALNWSALPANGIEKAAVASINMAGIITVFLPNLSLNQAEGCDANTLVALITAKQVPSAAAVNPNRSAASSGISVQVHPAAQTQ